MMNHFGSRFLNDDGTWRDLMKQKNSTSDMACLASNFPRLVGLAQASKVYRENKDLSKITFAQKNATENVFDKKNIPFRSFEIYKRDEKTLGELFCFFILETILIGKCLNLNPYDQPAVELIKKETKKLLI